MGAAAVAVQTPLAGRGWMSRIVRLILRVPLVAKLIGANVIIIAAAIVLHALSPETWSTAQFTTALVALSAATLVNLMLVRLALLPIENLEKVAERVSAGEFHVRNEQSPFADKDLAKLGDTLNALLDALARERKRIQDLGAEVVRAHDVERAKVSRELHDSIAQSLAAVRFQVAAASREEDPSEIRNRLAAVNGMISATMEEIVSVSYSLHSRVAEELGLAAALDSLARQVDARSGIEVTVDVDPELRKLSGALSVTLFKVAEETLRDIMMHSRAKSASVEVGAKDRLVRIEITYPCINPDWCEEQGLLSALAPVKDRVTLAGGSMIIQAADGERTRVMAELQTTESA